MSVCGISVAFAPLSPTEGQVPTCSSAVRHAAPEGEAYDLHALGTPPAFVLSQDQTLRCMGWTAAEAASAPIGMDRVRVHHHDSVVKVQMAAVRVTGE